MSDHTDDGEPSKSTGMTQAELPWEYNAPQFVDFNSPRALDMNDQADKWFDQQAHADAENFFSVPYHFSPEFKDKVEKNAYADGKNAGDEDDEADKSVYYDTDPADDAVEEEETEFTVEPNTPPKKRQRCATGSAASVVSSTSTIASSDTTSNNIVPSRGESARKMYPIATAAPRCSRSRSSRETREKQHSNANSSLRRSARPAAKTTEELEMEKIEVLKRRAQQALKLSQRSLTASRSGARKRTHAEIQPTMPREFHFQTNQRIKSHSMKTRQDETQQPSDFAKCLRSNRQRVSRGGRPPKGPTVPKPFHLTQTQVNPSKQEPGYTFHSDAEKVIRFQKDTPERFRTRPRNDPGPPPVDKHNQLKLTVPHTPNLVSRNRKRPVTVMSAAELEEQEVEEIKRFKFQAQPVNAKIFEKEVGIPKVERKEATKPVGFDLLTEKRPLVPRHPVEEEEKFEFRARPVPRNILEGTVGIRKAEPPPLTVPESPAFALKNRIRSVAPLDTTEADGVDRVIRANPLPHYGVTFQPKVEHKTTVPEPFSFDERDKQKMKEKVEKIQKIIEEETKPHEFYAQPVPNYDTYHDHIPKTKAKPITVPEPFNMESVQRYQQRQEQMERLREEELRQLKEAAQFKARPATIITKEPFMPKRVEKPLTEITEFELNTERRAHERELYEERKNEREAVLDELNKERQKRLEEEEQQELREMRQAMVHKAQPIKHFKSVTIHPSEKTLTEPMSPRFSERIKK